MLISKIESKMNVFFMLFCPMNTNTKNPLQFLSRIYAFLLDRLWRFNFLWKLNFCEILASITERIMAINKLLIVLMSYELTNNFRIKEAGKWLNKEKIIDISDLEKFHEKALYRTLEILKSNERENPPWYSEQYFSGDDSKKTDLTLDWASIVLQSTKSKLGNYGYSSDQRHDGL